MSKEEGRRYYKIHTNVWHLVSYHLSSNCKIFAQWQMKKCWILYWPSSEGKIWSWLPGVGGRLWVSPPYARQEVESVRSPLSRELRRSVPASKWKIFNKINSMAEAMRDEANLMGIFAFFYNKFITKKCLTLKMKVKVMKYNIHNVPFDSKYQLL